jgi:osmotically-inducible protein OsmY
MRPPPAGTRFALRRGEPAPAGARSRPHRERSKEAAVTAATSTQADVRVRDAVMKQLEWDPEVDATAIGVSARHGTVTLSGYVPTYSGKLAAERAAKRVRGVRAVANDVEVSLRLGRTDTDIAEDAARALALRATVPETVQAVVHDAHVTLTGNVEWLFQKESAERAVHHIRGVRGVFNHIAVKPRAAARDLRRRIVRALHQSADIDARQVVVEVAGDAVTLTGTVGSAQQRDAAERAAASAPGIARVDNRLVVQPAEEPPSEDADDGLAFG